jgi:hypothetical protein
VTFQAIPRITDQFHSLPDVGWYGGAYQLAGAALQPLSGKLYTYFDNKVGTVSPSLDLRETNCVTFGSVLT